MCSACYQNSDIACDDLSHQKSSMKRVLATGLPINCPRANNPPQDKPLFCNKCRQNVGICYLRKFPRLMQVFGLSERCRLTQGSTQTVVIAPKPSICVSTVQSRVNIAQVMEGAFHGRHID